MDLSQWTVQRPRLLLSILFVLWKGIILAIAFVSPGIGYDTSTDLLFASREVHAPMLDYDKTSSTRPLLFNLVRWDAIYFTHKAQHGNVFEQEWAFGIGMSGIMSVLERAFVRSATDKPQNFVVVGVALSHACHWSSVMTLYSITGQVLQPLVKRKEQIKFAAAALMIISPAGIFLSAPYAEGVFSCLHMLGLYLYLKASSHTFASQSLKLASGLVLGCGVVVRSNGVLSGLPFLIDALQLLASLSEKTTRSYETVRNLVMTVLGGSLVAVGAAVPQLIAYDEYCIRAQHRRAWCDSRLPSIFSWVQSHYWNVGFLRYWTVSNLPLFALSAPMLYVLILSGVEGCRAASSPLLNSRFLAGKIRSIALPQLILAILALTTYHVQIITRLSSAYPLWYIWLAAQIGDSAFFTIAIQFMVMYSIIQAGLYASFLPPA